MKKFLAIAGSICLLTACNNQAKEDALLKQQATLDSLNAVIAKQKAIDSVNKEKETYEEKNTQVESSGETTTTTEKKKGWSAKAKGAVIGAGVGAITGALVDKNHGAGALIGGVAGAGAGYGAGAVIDNKKKKETEQGN